MKKICRCDTQCANADMGMFLLRLVVGGIFIYHGWIKFESMAGISIFFDSLHIPSSVIPLIGTLDIVFGIALVVGMWTCLSVTVLASIVVLALIMLKCSRGNFDIEYELLVLASLFAIKHVGPGTWSLGDTCGCIWCEEKKRPSVRVTEKKTIRRSK